MKIFTLIFVTLTLGLSSCGRNSDARQLIAAPDKSPQQDQNPDESDHQRPNPKDIPPPPGPRFQCHLIPRKEIIQVPMNNGQWVAKPRAYLDLSIQFEEDIDELNLSHIKIHPSTFEPAAIQRQDEDSWQISFRPSEIASYQVEIQMNHLQKILRCQSLLSVEQIPADPNTIYIDEEWLESN